MFCVNKQFDLQGNTRVKLGEAFAREADVEYRGLAKCKLYPMIHFDQIICACRHKSLEGNLIIQTDSKVVDCESHHTIDVGSGR